MKYIVNEFKTEISEKLKKLTGSTVTEKKMIGDIKDALANLEAAKKTNYIQFFTFIEQCLHNCKAPLTRWKTSASKIKILEDIRDVTANYIRINHTAADVENIISVLEDKSYLHSPLQELLQSMKNDNTTYLYTINQIRTIQREYNKQLTNHNSDEACLREKTVNNLIKLFNEGVNSKSKTTQFYSTTKLAYYQKVKLTKTGSLYLKVEQPEEHTTTSNVCK